MDLSTKIRSLRTKESTKKQYLSKATIFKKWMDLNHPYLMEPVADLPWISNVNDHPEILEDFFGHICQKRTDDDSYYDPSRFQSYHHVNGYKSAILDLYRQSKVKPNDDIDGRSHRVGTGRQCWTTFRLMVQFLSHSIKFKAC